MGIIEPDAERAFPLLSLIGGKWTSFRAFSEQASDEVMERLGLARKLSTADLKIGGSKGLPTNPKSRNELIEQIAEEGAFTDKARIDQLLLKYGMKAVEIVNTYQEKLSDMLSDCPTISKGEIAYLWIKRMSFILTI